jgi:hypothetical protein
MVRGGVVNPTGRATRFVVLSAIIGGIVPVEASGVVGGVFILILDSFESMRSAAPVS